jgi:hypothetical protein
MRLWQLEIVHGARLVTSRQGEVREAGLVTGVD